MTMRSPMRAVALAAVIAAALIPGGARASHDSDTQAYQPGVGDVAVLFCGDDNYGGACFSLIGDPQPSTLTITVEDASGSPVGAYYRFDGWGEVPLEEGRFCVESAELPVPYEAARLVVGVDSALSGPIGCGSLLDGQTGIGTSGTITVTYTYPY
jgi:hypothetical protein